ncbi:MAG: cyclic nucleotide-binding domain-containing protein [Fimbriimonadaceae bacterium]|nr:cyclic nucleotide-binding domain-containing protein [Alphaproteobacteria bacterium]
MLLKEEVELLRRIPLFADIDPAKLKLLAFTSERLTFQPDQILFEQGDPGDAAYVVLSGTADILIDHEGVRIKVASVHANDFIGEIAILRDIPRTATVQASETLETLKISKEHFMGLLTEFPEMAIEIMRVLADRLAVTSAELSEAKAALK